MGSCRAGPAPLASRAEAALGWPAGHRPPNPLLTLSVGFQKPAPPRVPAAEARSIWDGKAACWLGSSGRWPQEDRQAKMPRDDGGMQARGQLISRTPCKLGPGACTPVLEGSQWPARRSSRACSPLVARSPDDAHMRPKAVRVCRRPAAPHLLVVECPHLVSYLAGSLVGELGVKAGGPSDGGRVHDAQAPACRRRGEENCCSYAAAVGGRQQDRTPVWSTEQRTCGPSRRSRTCSPCRAGTRTA